MLPVQSRNGSCVVMFSKNEFSHKFSLLQHLQMYCGNAALTILNTSCSTYTLPQKIRKFNLLYLKVFPKLFPPPARPII